MTRPRLIPVLLLKQGVIVRSQLFKVHQVIGNPMSTVERFSNWNVDELVLLDISGADFHDLRRDDIQQRYQGNSALDVLREEDLVENARVRGEQLLTGARRIASEYPSVVRDVRGAGAQALARAAWG